MQRQIDGVGELTIDETPVGSIEYQFQIAKGADGLDISGRVTGDPHYLTKMLTAKNVIVRGKSPGSSFKIFVKRYSLGDSKIIVSAELFER